jgi:hypothetical protein
MGELLEEWHLTPPPENTTTVTTGPPRTPAHLRDQRRLTSYTDSFFLLVPTAIIRQKNPRIDWFLLVLVVQLNEDYHELPYVYM